MKKIIEALEVAEARLAEVTKERDELVADHATIVAERAEAVELRRWACALRDKLASVTKERDKLESEIAMADARIEHAKSYKRRLKTENNRLREKIASNTEENNELNRLFDLQWKRCKQATRMWQEAHGASELVHPDLGRLIEWLIERGNH